MAAINLQTFGDVSEYLLRRIMKWKTVYFVTDQYHPGSIKSFERKRRQNSTGSLRVKVERRDQKRPKQWAKFLRNDQNKAEIVQFLLEDWSDASRFVDYFPPETILYVNVGAQFFHIKSIDGRVVSSEERPLSSTQEEADTKVFLCAEHAASLDLSSICISTVDTDIAIYAMYFNHLIDIQIFVQIGVGDRKRIIDIGDICIELGEDVCMALPGLHCFTGNDYTSAFHGIGKKKAFTIMRENTDFIQAFSKLGEGNTSRFTFDPALFATIQAFTCKMYGLAQCQDTDIARYQKFCKSKKKCPEPQQLPPTKDVLLCHLKRVNYATAVIKKALYQHPNLPSPDGYGWKIVDGFLDIEWMLRKPIPDVLIDFMSCGCKKNMCKSNQCVCVAHKLKCTDLCTCCNCSNANDSDSDRENDESESESDEELSDESQSEDEN